jgi:hypothetical protein
MLRCKTAPDPKDYVALPPPKYGGPTAETSLTTEPSCKDEARIGQKNSLTRVWGQTGSRPAAPKDLGFASAYVFGAVCPAQAGGGGADHADLQYRRHEPPSQRDQQPSRRPPLSRGQALPMPW